MLVLSRYEKESIRIGDNIVVHVVRVSASKVRIGIEAAKDVRIVRGEYKETKQCA